MDERQCIAYLYVGSGPSPPIPSWCPCTSCFSLCSSSRFLISAPDFLPLPPSLPTHPPFFLTDLPLFAAPVVFHQEWTALLAPERPRLRQQCYRSMCGQARVLVCVCTRLIHCISGIPLHRRPLIGSRSPSKGLD